MEFTLLHQNNTAVVGSDPQAVLTIYEETYHTADSRSGIKPFKGIAIIADQSTIASDPDKAFRSLCDRIRLRGWETICIIIQYRRITLAVSGRVHHDHILRRILLQNDLLFRSGIYTAILTGFHSGIRIHSKHR